MTEEFIHLTFGPVQEFVSQARRTRDLWAGSYLLSYLAGSALASLAPHQVVLPAVDQNPLVQALRSGRNTRPSGVGDRVGSVPHVAELQASPGEARDVATTAVTAWDDSWFRVAQAVRTFLRGKLPGWTDATDRIWTRQVGAAWTATWVLGEASGLGRRKTLRDFDLPDEEGETCTCCGIREPLHAGNATRRAVRAFWAEAADSFDELLEVRPEGGERLCAICAIRRFLPRAAQAALGWTVPTGFPSTVTMASLPWRLDVLRHGSEFPELRQAVRQHVDTLRRTRARNGREIRKPVPADAFPGLQEKALTWPGDDQGAAEEFLRYDGDWLYPEVVRGREIGALFASPPPERADDLTKEQQTILQSLTALRDVAGKVGVRSPGTSYALLAMDGDHMGDLLQKHAAHKGKISEALGAFSGEVQRIVEGEGANGRLIYAGGDDLLALLPIDTALPVAGHLRQAYLRAFERYLPDAEVSISGGLVFAHMRAPLQQVVRTGHDILEDKAKHEAECDAVAVAVWKRPGIVLQFASKWNHGIVANVDEVRRGLGEGVYSRSFLHSLSDLYQATPDLSHDQLRALLAAQYLKSRERTIKREEAEARVTVLQSLRPLVGGPADPALLAVFLATGEV